jgi:hypothetical protein
MSTTTHTMIVKLSHETFVSLMRWLFREATTSFSLLVLSPPRHQKSDVALHGRAYGTADVYQCTCCNAPLTKLWLEPSESISYGAFMLACHLIPSSLQRLNRVLHTTSGVIGCHAHSFVYMLNCNFLVPPKPNAIILSSYTN